MDVGKHISNSTNKTHTNWRALDRGPISGSTNTDLLDAMERSPSAQSLAAIEMKTRRSKSIPHLDLPHHSTFVPQPPTTTALYNTSLWNRESENFYTNSRMDRQDKSTKGPRRMSMPVVMDPKGYRSRSPRGRDPTRPPYFIEPNDTRHVKERPRRPSKTPSVQSTTTAAKFTKFRKEGSQLTSMESRFTTDSETDSTSVSSEPKPDYTRKPNEQSKNGEGKDREGASNTCGETAENTGEENTENEDEDLIWRPYDQFGTYEWEFDDEKTFQEILKVIRLSLYGFLILALLLGTVASRIALFLLASDINQSKEARGQSITQLIIAFCVPIFINWVQAIMRIMFGGKEWPTFKMFILNVMFELLSTFGVCLLVFRVIPSTDFFTGMIVTFSTFQIPSILKVFSKLYGVKCDWKQPVQILCLFLAMAIQLGCPAYFLVRTFSTFTFSTFTITPDEDHSLETPANVTLLKDLGWELPLALGLVSLSWWENYFPVSDKSKAYLKRLQDTRDTCYFFSAPIKVGLILLLARYLLDEELSMNGWEPGDDGSQIEFYFIHFSLLGIILGSSIFCTYLGGLACKLQMQKVAFAFPLLLSPPASLAVVYLQCRYEFLPDSWHVGTWYCPNIEWENLRGPTIIGAVLWLSYCVTVSQIWFPTVERMAKAVRLFLPSDLNSILLDFNLTVRRREDKGSKAGSSDSYALNGTTNTDKSKKDETKSTIQDDSDCPYIYVCATMWHETKREMTQLLKSLFRLDFNNHAGKYSQGRLNVRDPDYFNMEIHILFDDAFEEDKTTKQFVPNQWVRQFVDCMEDAASSVYKGLILIPDPVKVETPYGGRYVWTTNGQNKLIVHLKDKNKIRHRKRWSQVMYMYYLLGFKMFGQGDDIVEEDSRDHGKSTLRNRKQKGRDHHRQKHVPLRQMKMRLHKKEYEWLVHKSENTFILTLDGDIDFKPKAVELLLDRMKKNRKVAAVCGRIHPIGSGPLVWYQQFEYAVSHWLQKAAEHVFGCVLCCPGCFSLFRVSALMDDNVLKTYTTKPTKARHYIQFEQGEDRWLCTLLLQQGYRIDYSACADAYTFAPESFAEFFNQRRRWSPSTMANMIDLLSSWRLTIRLNDNMSRLFMLYQAIILLSTIISPSFLILMMTYSFQTVLKLDRSWSYVLAVVPNAFYIFICLTKKNATQIKVGAVLAALYALVMMVITVSTIISIVEDNFRSPNVIFLALLCGIFITAGFLHPQELFCLLPGVLYFLTIPTSFLLLTTFYLCNLNNVTWGTREVVTQKSEEQLQTENEKEAQKKKTYSIFSIAGLKNIIDDVRDLFQTVWGLKKDLQDEKKGLGKTEAKTLVDTEAPHSQGKSVPTEPPGDVKVKWIHLPSTGKGPVETLAKPESEFWNFIIKKYLYPLDLNKDDQQKLSDNLRELRNNVVFIVIMINLLWTVIALQLQAAEDRLKAIYIAGRYEPLAVVFLAMFALILILQSLGMVIHSWGTFLHFMSTTRVDWLFHNHSNDEYGRYVKGTVAKYQSLEPREDYDDEDSSSNQSEQADLHDDTRSNHEGLSRRSNSSRSYARFSQNHMRRRSSKAGHFPRLDTMIDDRLRMGMRKSEQRSRELHGKNSSESGSSATHGHSGFFQRLHWPARGTGSHHSPLHHKRTLMKIRFQQNLRDSPFFGHHIEEEDDELQSVEIQR